MTAFLFYFLPLILLLAISIWMKSCMEEVPNIIIIGNICTVFIPGLNIIMVALMFLYIAENLYKVKHNKFNEFLFGKNF